MCMWLVIVPCFILSVAVPERATLCNFALSCARRLLPARTVPLPAPCCAASVPGASDGEGSTAARPAFRQAGGRQPRYRRLFHRAARRFLPAKGASARAQWSGARRLAAVKFALVWSSPVPCPKAASPCGYSRTLFHRLSARETRNRHAALAPETRRKILQPPPG